MIPVRSAEDAASSTRYKAVLPPGGNRLLSGRSFMVFMGALLLAVPLCLAAGFGSWIGANEIFGPSIAVASAGMTTVSVFIAAFMKAVKFLDHLVE